MDRVLDDREGLPITLSVLVMELARRCGVDGVVGVGAPGHFLVKYLYDNQEQFIDSFSGGKLLSVPEVEELDEVGYSLLLVFVVHRAHDLAFELIVRRRGRIVVILAIVGCH